MLGNIVDRMQSRAMDKYGSGQFHAGRSSGKKRHSHQGLDIAATAGERVFSPIDGTITREAIPYPPFTGLVIQGAGDYADYEIKLFYVQGHLCGRVHAGDEIGRAQDLTITYPGITNHVHMEIRKRGSVLSPLDTYQMCF